MSYELNLALFATLVFGIVVVPGMDMLMVLTNSVAGGRRQGLATVMGVLTGGAVHTVAASVGFGTLVTLWPQIATALTLVGSAYMIWAGAGLARSLIKVGAVGSESAVSAGRAYATGLVSCLTNPKAYLFMLAVFPQFVKADYGELWWQMTVMGLVICITQLVVYGTLAVSAASSRNLFNGNAHATVIIGRVAGYLLIAAALVTAWHGFAGSQATAQS